MTQRDSWLSALLSYAKLPAVLQTKTASVGDLLLLQLQK